MVQSTVNQLTQTTQVGFNMSGLIIVPKTFAFDSSVPVFRNDAVQSAGSLLLLDFSRDDCWNSGTLVNLAADTATVLTGAAQTPTLSTPTIGNSRRLNHALGLGAANTHVVLPTTLVDYIANKNIAYSVFQRYINTPQASLIPWTASLPVNLNDIVYSGVTVYTVTVAGTLGVTAPVHLIGSGAATNGTATLTAGVKTTVSAYGIAAPNASGTLWLGNGYPTSYNIISTGTTAHVTPYSLGYNMWSINHITTSPARSSINGLLSGTGRQLTTTQVPTIPSSKTLRLGHEMFNATSLYNATAGAVPQNLNGVFLDIYRIHIEDLDVSGRTHDEFYAAEAAFFRTYHPARALMP